MAKKVSPAKEVNARWVKLLEKEAEIIENQPVDFKIHSGWKLN
jgi:tRNA isopentenyl-2-thiomethyl-A-37 hydroxylase MiaE